MQKVIIVFISFLILLTGCTVGNEGNVAAETAVNKSTYSISNGRIFDHEGKEITANLDFSGPDTCQIGENINAFDTYKEFDNSKYLAANYIDCLCQSDCSMQNLYIFDLKSNRHITHTDLSEAILSADPEIGEAISVCHQSTKSKGQKCYWYQIKEIREDAIILNIFRDDPSNEGEYVYHCSSWLFADLDSSVNQVERICGFKLEKEMKIENMNRLF